MIEVSCPSARRNNHRYMYNMSNNSSLIQLAIDENGIKFEMELRVSEAEQLANELLEWVREIKGDEEEETA